MLSMMRLWSVVAKKQLKYPRYSDAEVMRKALVGHLKDKGYLDKDKSYL